MANERHGIEIEGAPGTLIGSFLPGAGNVISGNSGHGILLSGNDATGTQIKGNYIGTNESDADLGNFKHGILIRESSNNMIGGAVVNEGNTIAYNGVGLDQRGHGIVIESGTGNAIRRNSMYSNAGRGIDLVNPFFPLATPYAFNIADGGEDANGNLSLDPGEDQATPDRQKDGVLQFPDADAGANNLQNAPHVDEVIIYPSLNEKVVEWVLYGPRHKEFSLEVFSNEEADPSGFGEGKVFLEEIILRTDEHGRGHGLITEIPLEFIDGEFVGPLLSATVTDENGNTSEFSLVDTDGDAVADRWETDGIDIDEDGIRDYPPADSTMTPTNPFHKDLFVEIDSMECVFRSAIFPRFVLPDCRSTAGTHPVVRQCRSPGDLRDKPRSGTGHRSTPAGR